MTTDLDGCSRLHDDAELGRRRLTWASLLLSALCGARSESSRLGVTRSDVERERLFATMEIAASRGDETRDAVEDDLRLVWQQLQHVCFSRIENVQCALPYSALQTDFATALSALIVQLPEVRRRLVPV